MRDNARQQPKQGTLASRVATDDAQRLAVAEIETDVFQNPEGGGATEAEATLAKGQADPVQR
ncbi:hypothetical protein [Thiocystis minor]|uniref:hypothetical protein n=1 Tax=Thiocystis minor TaxID=61597 RepID=UPI001F5C54C1|nr:hypothetical protein [Thiocystis minor]